jgi:Holliday junction DNA helicase RuvA
MIVGVEGEILLKEPTFLHMKVGGFVYEINISLNTSNAIYDHSFVQLLITQIVREDNSLLYGFLDQAEKKLFDKLIKINGIGPKVALAICSTFTPEEFVQVIKDKNLSLLKKVPGIGPKSANRILVELMDFDLGIESSVSNAKKEAILALESLGFKKDEIIKVLSDENAKDSATLVKLALKKLAKI